MSTTTGRSLTKLSSLALALSILLAPHPAQAFWGTLLGGAAGGFVGGWLGSRHQSTNVTYVQGGNTYNISEVDYGRLAEENRHALQNEFDDDILPQIEAAARKAAAESYAGARKGAYDGVTEGLRVYFLQQQQAELQKKMDGNVAIFRHAEPKLDEQVDALGTGHGAFACSAYCGGLDEKGTLSATPIVLGAASREAGFQSLEAQCPDDRVLFRDVRNVKMVTGKIYQKVIVSQKLTACDPVAPTDAAVITPKTVPGTSATPVAVVAAPPRNGAGQSALR